MGKLCLKGINKATGRWEEKLHKCYSVFGYLVENSGAFALKYCIFYYELQQ